MHRSRSGHVRALFRAGLTLSVLLGTQGCDETSKHDAGRRSGSRRTYHADNPCSTYVDVSRRLSQRRAAEDSALFDRAVAGTAYPVAAAEKAIREGDFRLIGYSRRAPGIELAAYGVTCRPSLKFSHNAIAVRSLYAASDVPTEALTARAKMERHSHFGLGYNKALLADPRYPYRDVCRLETSDRADPVGSESNTPIYGYNDLTITEQPLDLGEAARRGTLRGLKERATAAGGAINAPDLFDMTPLAWAVAYNRADHVQALLRAGASPAGAACRDAADPNSPIQIARAMHHGDLVRVMLPFLAVNVSEKLSEPPRAQAYDTAARQQLGLLLEQHRSDFSPGNDLIIGRVTISAQGSSERCTLNPGKGSAVYDRRTCAIILKMVRWRPATNVLGDRVSGTGVIRLRIRPDTD